MARLVKLHGVAGGSPTDPRDALRALLDPRGENVGLGKLTLEQLEDAWRDYLRNKLLVLVLDDAADEAQVKPFLPGDSPYIVLITGRRVLQGLLATGTGSFPLDVLGPDGAALMIANMLGPRSVGDQLSVARIAELCGYQPLAIELAVKPLAGRPGISLADKYTELASHPDPVAAIDARAAAGSLASAGVARAFESSYSQLPEDVSLLLRRLAMAPVPFFTSATAAALADLPRSAAADRLGRLVLESLISEDDEGQRYELHPLLREFAANLAKRDDAAGNDDAVARLLAYYAGAAAQADALLTRQPLPFAGQQPAPSVLEVFTSRPAIIGWTRAELPNLLACADYAVKEAATSGRPQMHGWVMTFAAVLAGILRSQSQWRRSIDLQTHAAESAEASQLPLGVANALAERGMLHRLTGELDDARKDLERAISIYEQHDSAAARTGEAHARNTYGVVLDQLEEPDEAKKQREVRQQLTLALGLHRRAGDRLGEANVLNDQGMTEYFAKNYAGAIPLLGQALELYRAVDHPLGMAHAYKDLGRAQQFAGAEDEAAANLESARAMYAELANGLGQINVTIPLALALRKQNPHRAAKVLAEAVTLSEKIGNPAAGIAALDELGELQLADGDGKAAGRSWSTALRLAREHGMEREAAKLTVKVRRGR